MQIISVIYFQSLTSFLLFLLILGATHAQEIATIASADLQEIEDNTYWPMDADTGVLGVPLYYSNNEKRMHTGQHLATGTFPLYFFFSFTVLNFFPFSVMMFLLYTGVVLVSIHFLSCLLLLYGAVKNISHFLLPWTSTVLLSLILGAFALLIFAFLPYRECKIGIYTAGTTLIGLELYAWLVVFSFYRELTCGSICREVDNIVVSYPIETYKYPKIDI